MQQKNQLRNMSVDLLKVISICGVIIIHTTAGGGGLSFPIGSFQWFSSIFWGSLIRFSVPLFFMCSGALMLDADRNVTLENLYKKYLPRLIIALFAWAAAYKIFELITTDSFNLNSILYAIKEMILFRHHGHLYYLHILIINYALLPLMRRFCHNATKQELIYVIILWLAFGIIYPAVQGYYPFTLITGIPAQYAINMTYSSIGYGLTGYYLSTHKPTKALPFGLLYLLGFAITFTGAVYLSLSNGENNFSFWEGMSPGPACMAIGLFGFITVIFRNKKSPQMIITLSKASFCIFLVHDFFNIIFRQIGFLVPIFTPLLSIPFISGVVLVLSFLVYLVLSKIPWVNRYLI